MNLIHLEETSKSSFSGLIKGLDILIELQCSINLDKLF